MVQWEMMFGAVIIHIGSYGITIVPELILISPEVYPVEAHVHVFGAFGDDFIVCDTSGGRVFCLEG